MSKKDIFIFEVSAKSFDTSVLQNSHKIPVLVEFMGVWSGPCIQMSDSLSGLASEFAGQFIFAKIDIDEQAELAKQYDIKNVPCLKVIKDGQVIATEEGMMTEEELRTVLKNQCNIFSEAIDLRNQARAKHIAGETVAAIQLLTQAMQKDPSDVNTALDMTQIFVDIGELQQATSLFNQLPDSAKNSDMGKLLIGQITFLELASKTIGIKALQQQLISDPEDCDALFDLAVCLIAAKEYPEAVEHLLTILKYNNSYKDGAAKELIISLSNMLAPNNPELAAKFRQRLGSLN